MGQALYRKYRSKRLDEILGQEHITVTLSNALKNGRISHAYLFTGPKGVGKTSIARILAHDVNGFDYKDDQTLLDIIEIDAASNRRIDEIRELRDKVYNAPTVGKYKVYIIDEVHMLTREAFNALLKILEEPPTHVIFILATTEAHKLPDTIISRTQRFTFKPIESKVIISQLRMIANKEKINVSDDALTVIAQHADGSFRDSISLLDQASNSTTELEKSDIEKMLGVVAEQTILNIIDFIIDGDSVNLVKSLDALKLTGSSAPQIAKQLIAALRIKLVSGNDVNFDKLLITKLMRRLIEVPASHDPNAALDLILLETSFINNAHLPEQVKPKETAIISKTAPVRQNSPKTAIELEKIEEPKQQIIESLEPSELWPKVLSEIKKHHNTLYSIARMAVTSTGENNLELQFNFPFHQKRIAEAKNTQIIVDTIFKLTGQKFTVKCSVVDKKHENKVAKKTDTQADNIKTISNIFGGAEVLES